MHTPSKKKEEDGNNSAYRKSNSRRKDSKPFSHISEKDEEAEISRKSNTLIDQSPTQSNASFQMKRFQIESDKNV